MALLFLLLKIVRRRQENKMIQQMNQLLAPIAHDVLLEKTAPAAKLEGQNIAAIKKTLQGIDLNAMSKKSANQKIQPAPASVRAETQHRMNDVALEKNLATYSSHNQTEIAGNLKRFDAEFENLLSNLEKRAQMRKK